MMNKQEKEAVRLMAMEAYDILDDISGSVFFTLKNGKDMVAIEERCETKDYRALGKRNKKTERRNLK